MTFDIDQFNEINKSHAINYFAILFALMHQGILTYEDWQRAMIEATHFVDQAAAELAEKHRDNG